MAGRCNNEGKRRNESFHDTQTFIFLTDFCLYTTYTVSKFILIPKLATILQKNGRVDRKYCHKIKLEQSTYLHLQLELNFADYENDRLKIESF